MEKIIFYFDVYQVDPSGESLEIQNSVPFESRYLQNARKEIDFILNEVGGWEQDDFLIISLTNSNSEVIYEGKLFNNEKWDDLIDNNFLDSNKFKLLCKLPRKQYGLKV